MIKKNFSLISVFQIACIVFAFGFNLNSEAAIKPLHNDLKRLSNYEMKKLNAQRLAITGEKVDSNKIMEMEPTIRLLEALLGERNKDSSLKMIESPQNVLDLINLQSSKIASLSDECPGGILTVTPVPNKDIPTNVGEIVGYHIALIQDCGEPSFSRRTYFLFTAGNYRTILTGKIGSRERQVVDTPKSIWYSLIDVGWEIEYVAAYGQWGTGTTEVLVLSHYAWSGGGRSSLIHQFEAHENDEGGVILDSKRK